MIKLSHALALSINTTITTTKGNSSETSLKERRREREGEEVSNNEDTPRSLIRSDAERLSFPMSRGVSVSGLYDVRNDSTKIEFSPYNCIGTYIGT